MPNRPEQNAEDNPWSRSRPRPSPFGEASRGCGAELRSAAEAGLAGDQDAFAKLYDATSAQGLRAGGPDRPRSGPGRGGRPGGLPGDLADGQQVRPRQGQRLRPGCSRSSTASRWTGCGLPKPPPAATRRTNSATRRSTTTRRPTQHTPRWRPAGCATRWRASRPFSARRWSWPLRGLYPHRSGEHARPAGRHRQAQIRDGIIRLRDTMRDAS